MCLSLRLYAFCAMLLALCYATPAKAQDDILPRDLVLDQRLSYNEYTHLVIPTIDWLQNTPLEKDLTQRRRLDNFLMYWLQKNDEVVVNMPDFLINFQNVHGEFYFIYTGGWIKHALTTGDTTRLGCSKAAVNSVLDFYKKNKTIRRSDYMDMLLRIRKDNKLASLYDTSKGVVNTYLHLKPPSDKHEFKPSENYFSFRYTAVNFINAKGIHYRYKLEGYYDKWIYSTEQVVTFPNLPPGSYVFRVQASIYPDFSNVVEEAYDFSIAAPIWRRGWFITLMIIAGVVIVLLYMSGRERRLKDVANLQQERIVYEYEHLKSQVNPHFLFNSLNTLTSLIEDNPQKAIVYTENLSDLYRNMLTHRSRDLVLLSEELDILNNYIHIQKSRFGDALQLHTDIPEEVLRTKKIVPLALQLLIENAIKHNIVSRTQPLVITVTVSGEELIVRNPVQPKMSKEKSSGLGLANISKRYAVASKRSIAYGEENGIYTVRLPLL